MTTTTRVLIYSLLILICLAGVGIITQRRQLLNLRADQQQLLTLVETKSTALAFREEPIRSLPHLSSELLKLRSTVTQLMRKKNELASARIENERLQSQLTARGNNSATLPADYIRASQAQWVGTSTIENTIQSFFWALRHHDTNALFQVLTVRSGEQLSQQIQHSSADELFKEPALFPGMRITERTQLPDGTVEAKIEMLPGKPELNSFHFQLVQ